MGNVSVGEMVTFPILVVTSARDDEVCVEKRVFRGISEIIA